MASTVKANLVDNKPKRWPIHAVWVGFLITLFGALSYFLYFYQFPNLRDFPVVNLPIVFLGLFLVGAGGWEIFKQSGRLLAKGFVGVGVLLSLGIAGLFNFYVFSMSYQLPESADSIANEAAAPEITLLDHEDHLVSLSESRGNKVVLVFYRGDW